MTGHLPQNTGIPLSHMRILGSFATVYLLHGTGWFQDARGYQRDLVPGDLIMLYPEIKHAYGPPAGQTWGEFYTVFDGPVFELWHRQKLLNPDAPIMHLEPIPYWQRRWEQIAVPGLDPLQQVCRLQNVLADALIMPAQRKQPEWLVKAKSWLEDQSLELEEVAQRVGMSYENFRKRFAQSTGTTPARYRTERVMEQACALVASSELTNKEIARHLGLCDEFHFSRRFKQITGTSPNQFRKRLPSRES